MADILKVLMMGGQRTGKTSMLAGLIETMTHGTVKDIVEVKDVTESKPASLKLIKSIESLKWNLLPHTAGPILLMIVNLENLKILCYNSACLEQKVK